MLTFPDTEAGAKAGAAAGIDGAPDALASAVGSDAARAAPAPELVLAGIGKTYGDFTAVQDVSLSVRRGEFVTILGPSGSGKTTTLMMIAGFIYPSSGSITVRGQNITYMPPHRRDLGMMFQNYALFPHLTIADNVAFPLRMRRMKREEIRERVRSALELVQLREHADKFASQLSGGQQQRVALARALVYGPSLLLMDEPLAALDKGLREHMQIQIKRIQKASGVTIIYVTHDQDEALAMSDRVVVMDKGRIRVVDSPTRLYERPSSDFVAQFVGETNLMAGVVTDVANVGQAASGAAAAPEASVDVGAGVSFPVCGALAKGDRISVSVRPERLRCTTEPVEGFCLPATVSETIYLGDIVKYQLRVSGPGGGLSLVAKTLASREGYLFPVGSQLYVSWAKEDAWLLSK